MNPWKIFSELCRQVVEERSVFLYVFFGEYGLTMELRPLNETDLEEDMDDD